MSVLTIRRPLALLGTLLPKAPLARVGEYLRQRRAYSRALRELRALSDRELEDLGISRWMITRVAAEAAYGKRH